MHVFGRARARTTRRALTRGRDFESSLERHSPTPADHRAMPEESDARSADASPSAKNDASTTSSSAPRGAESASEGAADVGSLLDALVRQRLDATATRLPTHEFWETQPVGQFGDDARGEALKEGPIDAPKTPKEVPEEGGALPPGYEWCSCDLTREKTQEEVYELLTNNYVEDDDAMFRFHYSQEFLKWALRTPGYHEDWHVGVRLKVTQTLVAFISGVPGKLRVNGKEIEVAEINFLCIHKKLRSKRIAPTLIKEVTRRVNLRDVWQAVYTAGVVLPKPISRARYWHRSLDIRKLVEIGFTRLGRDNSMSRAVQAYKLSPKPKSEGLRHMTKNDVPKVTALLSKYLSKFTVAPILSEAEVEHLLLPREDVVYSYVVEDEKTKKITDLISFYNLPSQIIHGNTKHKTLKAAYSYYNVATSVPLVQLMEDALILAKCNDFDVFNALDLMENDTFLRELKFGIGDGNLHYYLFNWRVMQDIEPSQVALVLT